MCNLPWLLPQLSFGQHLGLLSNHFNMAKTSRAMADALFQFLDSENQDFSLNSDVAGYREPPPSPVLEATDTQKQGLMLQGTSNLLPTSFGIVSTLISYLLFLFPSMENEKQ